MYQETAGQVASGSANLVTGHSTTLPDSTIPPSQVQSNRPMGSVQVNMPRRPVQVNLPRAPVNPPIQATSRAPPIIESDDSDSEETVYRNRRVFAVADRESSRIVIPRSQYPSILVAPQSFPNVSLSVPSVPPTTVGESESPAHSVLELDGNGYNAIGRAVQMAIGSIGGGGYSYWSILVRVISLFCADRIRTENANRYQEIWRQSGGPQLLAAASQLNVVECGEQAYLSQNACFSYMLIATNIPLPGAPSSVEFNEALAYIGLTEFLSNTHRVENLRRMLEASTVALTHGNYNLRSLYFDTVGVNWIIRCPVITNTPTLRQAVFRHRLYRYISLEDGSSGHQVEFEQIRRQDAFLDSSAALTIAAPMDIRQGVSRCTFAGEDAYGVGVERDWFTTVASQIFFNDRYFQSSNGLRIISSQGSDNYYTIGRFLALSLVQGIEIGVKLPRSYYARLLDRDVTVEMIAEFDQGVANSLRHARDCSDDDIDLYFAPIAGSGFTEDVTRLNRSAQLKAALLNLGVNGQNENFSSLARGFNEILPTNILGGFTPEDIDNFVYGNPIISVEDFRNHVRLGGGYEQESVQIGWLFDVLGELSQEELGEFLRFVTSNTQLPFGGFGALDPPIRIVSLNYVPDRLNHPTS